MQRLVNLKMHKRGAWWKSYAFAVGRKLLAVIAVVLILLSVVLYLEGRGRFPIKWRQFGFILFQKAIFISTKQPPQFAKSEPGPLQVVTRPILSTNSSELSVALPEGNLCTKFQAAFRIKLGTFLYMLMDEWEVQRHWVETSERFGNDTQCHKGT